MLINCTNCGSKTDLPEVLDKDTQTVDCETCGSPVFGIEYSLCPKCKHKVFSIEYLCSHCGCNIAGYNDSLTDENELNEDEFDYLNKINYEYITDKDKLAESIKEIIESGYKQLAVDTETTGLDPYTSKMLLIQISTPEKVYIYDCLKLDKMPLVKELLEKKDYVKILQNAKFDFKMLKHHYNIELNNIFDTMLAERTITAGISREIGLKSITEKYLNRYMDKSTRTTFLNHDGNFSKEQLRYAAEDVIVLHPIYEMQKEELVKKELTKIAELEFKALIAVGDMELNGIKLDIQKWKALMNDASSKKAVAEKKLLDIILKGTGGEEQQSLFKGMHSINLNSNTQLLDAFKKIKGLKKLKDTSSATLQDYKDHPAIQALLEYRKYEKLLTSFGDSILELVNPVTGRIHPEFNQFGADTGRFSCQKPNVQQIPHDQEFRECFIAEKGNKLITADYSQAELRILAQLSEDPKFIEAFCSGGDLHKLTASQMFNVPVEEVEKPMRSAAKTINFGLAYGRGASSLAGQLGVEADEAKKLIGQYFNAYSGVRDWLEKAAKDAFDKGYSLTPSGRKRFFEKPRHNDKDYNSKKAAIERQGKNTPIQGANADITKYALIFLYETMKKYDAKLVNTVHDEITVEAPADKAEEVQKVLEGEMQRAGAEVVKLVPMKVDGEVADYWTK